MGKKNYYKKSDGTKTVTQGGRIIGNLPSNRSTNPVSGEGLGTGGLGGNTATPAASDHAALLSLVREHLGTPDTPQSVGIRPKVGSSPYAPTPAASIFNPESPDYESIEEMEENVAGYIEYVQNNPNGAWEIENGEAEDYKFQRVGSGFLYRMKMGGHDDGTIRDPSELPHADRAFAFSKDAHRSQTDKLGVPYFLHPRGVADYMDSLPEYQALSRQEKEDAKVAAYLHDVVEDTNYTRADLESLGFRKEALDVIDAVTAPKGMPKDVYYEQVKAAGPVAVAVKLADLGHNNLQARRAQLPGAPGRPVRDGEVDQYAKLGHKYVKAYRAFGVEVPAHLQEFAN